jgi:hypothetical protein
MLADAPAGNEVVLSFSDRFDAAEGWRLHDVLAKLEPGTRVTLDFSKVRDFHDFAIALLARDLESLSGRIRTRGLCQHQLRMLRYFGVETPCPEVSAETFA